MQYSSTFKFLHLTLRFDGSYPYTGHHSPLYALPEEEDPNHEFYGFNTDYAINYWLDGGASKDQILLGVPAYGRGFVLADANDNGLYAPATGPNPAGPYTQEEGYLSFLEYCEIMNPYTIVRVLFNINLQHMFSIYLLANVSCLNL